MGEELDYRRFGRQIALPEVGPEGQRRLGSAPVRFRPHPVDSLAWPFAGRLHTKAGGQTPSYDDAFSPALEVPVRVAPEFLPAVVGVAAFYAVEAARRVLGQPPVEIPAALLERLGAPPAK